MHGQIDQNIDLVLADSLGQAVACNEDCSVIVGYAGAASNQAWRWTQSGGAEYLGELSNAAPNSTYVAIGVSANAHLIVGSYFAFDPVLGNVNRPFLWTPADHLQDLVAWLAFNGIDYGADFHDLVANSVTPDGRKILLNGLDDIGQTLQKKSSIDRFEAKAKDARPWL